MAKKFAIGRTVRNRLRKLVRRIPEDNFDIGTWFKKYDPEEGWVYPPTFAASDIRNILGHSCDTVACLAGWQVVFSSEKVKPNESISEFARRTLDLTDEQASRLFSHQSWPNQFQGSHRNVRNLHDRVEHFIRTGE